MAARENQGLQIALIIFVMLTIVLIVTTFLFFRNYTEQLEKNKSLAAEIAQKTTAASTAMAESEAYKNLIGAAVTDKLDAVQTASTKDLDTYGKTIPEGKRNYRFLVEFLATELKNANVRIADLTTEKTELANKLKADEDAKIKEIAEYTQKLNDTAKDMADEHKKFSQDRQEINNSKSDLAQKFEGKRKEHEQLTKDSSAKIASVTADNDKLKKLLDALHSQSDEGERRNEMPDGKVTWVNQRSRTVWINLGSEDGLRRQTSFSVVAADQSNPAKGKRKGKIEVVRLMERHLAEASIVEDDLSNPMMPGDNIFSPSWEPGRAEHFALAGKLDIDGDGEPDNQRIRDLIALNGGVVDEEITTDNKKVGQMSINTKYLILGEKPTEKTEAKIDRYSEIIGEAQTLGVKTMPINEFLDYMGYKLQDRTVNLGKHANPNDFKPRLPDGRQRVLPGSAVPQDVRKGPAPSN